MSTKGMWEILVPTERRAEPGKYYTTRYHRVWDGKVRAITGGLTVMAPARGQWINPMTGDLFQERMIPVRIMATRDEIDKIVDMTLKYYNQLAILCYKISDEVILKFREE